MRENGSVTRDGVRAKWSTGTMMSTMVDGKIMSNMAKAYTNGMNLKKNMKESL